MVTEVTTFRSTTGKAFDTEFEAWGEELRDFLVKHGADNDAIARKIVQCVIDDQPETLATLADIVENMHRCAPEVVRAAQPLIEASPPLVQCGDCGGINPFGDECHFCNPL